MFRVLLIVAATLFASTEAEAGNSKTWYVYCEGHAHGVSWAVFSRNMWQSPVSDNYGRRVGSRAEEFIESNHRVNLSGCSGVQFFDAISARYSRDRTVRLHKKMGDRIFFFNLPAEVLSQ